MSVKKDELIAKLEKISELYSDTVEIATEIRNFTPEDNYKRTVKVPIFPGEYESSDERESWEFSVNHEDEDAIEQMTQEYEINYHPNKPVERQVEKIKEITNTNAAKAKQKFGCMPFVCAFIAVISLFTVIIPGYADPTTLIINWIVVIACAVAIVFFLLKMKNAKVEDEKTKIKMQKAHQEQVLKAKEEYKEAMSLYESECASYELRCKAFIEKYTAWRKNYLKSVKEEAEIEEKLKADRALAVNRMFEEKFTPAKTKLDEYNNDLIAEEYLPSINVIIGLLKSGRADDLKEAINLYEEIVYKEKQLQLEREKEEQRRLEEERRRQDEERRYREEMSFKEKQERQRRLEETQRRNDEERRFKEEQRARESERQDALQQQRNAQAQAKSNCHWCQNYRNCAKRHNPPIYCPAFRPGNTHQI